jgi:hypothetical protein
MQVSWRRARLSASLGVLLLSAWSCGPEREVLGDRDPEEDLQGPSTGGQPAAFGPTTAVAGVFGASTGGFGTAGGACNVDADCSDAAVCVDNQCVFCGHAAQECFVCPPGLEPVTFARAAPANVRHAGSAANRPWSVPPARSATRATSAKTVVPGPRAAMATVAGPLAARDNRCPACWAAVRATRPASTPACSRSASAREIAGGVSTRESALPAEEAAPAPATAKECA